MDLMGGARSVHHAAYLSNDGRTAVNDLGSHFRSNVIADVQRGILREQHAPVIPSLRIHEPAVARLGAFDGLDREKLFQRVHGCFLGWCTYMMRSTSIRTQRKLHDLARRSSADAVSTARSQTAQPHRHAPHDALLFTRRGS